MTHSQDTCLRSASTVRTRSLGVFAFCLAPFAVGACSSADSTSTDVSVAQQAVEAANCGYSLATKVIAVNKKGFVAKVKVTNAQGPLNSTGFTVLVGAGAAKLLHVGHGSFEVVETGYLLSTSSDDESQDDDEAEDDADVLAGRAYRFTLKFEGTYTKLSANIISSSGVACDQTVPTVKLTASGDFFTSDKTLTLNAETTDNVAVSKVVFTRDNEVIGTDYTAPYSLAVPVTNAINGRHAYAATAYDLNGNAASQAKRVLVAIGNKFFGTAATNAADYAGLLAHFNQVTPGNAGKWGSVEATRDQMNWTELDTAYNFAKANHISFKLHTLVWGQQQPSWLAGLSAEEQLTEIDQWMTALAARYPDVDLIDVVNEPLHAPPSYAAALGGAGTTGWDWVIKSFEMARTHFPKAELLMNDYSVLTLESATQSYLGIVKLLSDRGLIDGVSEQGHFYERAPELAIFTKNLDAFAATGLPVYISELDLNYSDDARQANRMKDLFTTIWSNPSVLGVTHWGYLQGNMWQSNAYLIRTDGTLRPALTWIECFRAGGANCSVPAIVPQPRTGDVNGIALEAEEYDGAHALLPAGNVVAYASDGSWLSFEAVAFNDNWNTLNVTYAQGNTNTPTLTVHLDSVDNAPVATVPLASTGGWSTMKTVSIPWAPVGAQKNVFVRFNGGGANVDKLSLSAPSGTGKNLIVDSDFELGTKDGWSTWASGTIANTTARAVSGTHAVAMTARTGNSPLAENLTGVVVPGKTYKVSLWATVGGASTASAYVTTAIQCNGGTTTYGRLGGWENAKTVADGTWVEFAGDLVIPDCQLTNVGMWLEGPGAGVDLYIDHASVRQQTSSNIVPNGTFESGTANWFTWSGGTIAASTARAHGGAQSLLVSGRTNNAPAATNITTLVKPGTSYPFSLWASIQSPDASSKALNVTQATTCKNADGTSSTSYGWIGGPTTVPDGNTWTQVSGTIAIAASCNLTQLQIFVEGGAGADLYVDDVQIIDNGGAPANLITDGTFESGQGAWGGWGFTSLSVSSVAHAGTSSLVGAGMQSNGAIARDIKALVAPGKRYSASAWVSVGNLTAPATTGSVKFQTNQICSGVTSYPWLAGATVSSGAWVQVTGTVDLTACTTIDGLSLFVGADSGDLYVDDVTLTALP